MAGFFTRQRFGRPQFLAGALLLLFLAQAIWLVHSELRMSESSSLSASEQVRIAAGWRQIHGGPIAGAPFPDALFPDALSPDAAGALPLEISRDNSGFDTEHSPLISLVTAAPLLAWPQGLLSTETHWRWLPRIPFLAFGVFLGASLWYVARRLCGNTGGFLALTLYCFSPAILQATAVWHAEPEILAAWGSFGSIFTSDRRRPHSLRTTRSRSLELAPHPLARHLPRDLSRIAIFHDHRRSARPCVHALPCSHPPGRSLHHLDHLLSSRDPHFVLHIFLSRPYIFRSHAARLVLGSHLAQLHRARRLWPSRAAASARLPRLRAIHSIDCRNLRRLAAYPLLRQYRSHFWSLPSSSSSASPIPTSPEPDSSWHRSHSSSSSSPASLPISWRLLFAPWLPPESGPLSEPISSGVSSPSPKSLRVKATLSAATLP